VHVAAAGYANLAKAQSVQSLLQLITRPEECNGKEVDVGAYIVIDPEHKVGFLEYGLSEDGGELHLVDNSPIGFELDSPHCRISRQKKERVLAKSDILGMFSARHGAYGFVRGNFEKDSSQFDAGRICDITALRLLPDSVRNENE
jgi:hypothetical protein